MKTEDKEKRQHPRIGTSNLVSYALYNESGTKVHTGKGRTMNLSQSGVMLETKIPLEGSFIILMTIDLEGKKLKIKGKVAHTQSDTVSGYYLSGIEFIESEDKQREVIVAFVKVYHHRKHLAEKKREKPVAAGAPTG